MKWERTQKSFVFHTNLSPLSPLLLYSLLVQHLSPGHAGLPFHRSPSLSISVSFPPAYHLSSRCHVVDEFNLKPICNCPKTHTEVGSILCSDTLWKQSLDAFCVPGRPEKTFCHAPKKLSFNGNSEVNKVVPVAFVIYNTLSISASGELDSPLDSEGQPKVTRC